MDIVTLVTRARTSSFYLWLLNFAFDRMVPFNRPHGFRITAVTENTVCTKLPYRRSNLNHVKGLHACALATLTEMTSGFLLAVKLDPSKYRLILRKLEVDYLYQGKMDAVCEFSISQQWLEEKVFSPLSKDGVADIIAEVMISDIRGNQLTAGKAYWQIKDWSKVKTKA
jgi:acyl-coenzyme A thioesterase PaaI-like protein